MKQLLNLFDVDDADREINFSHWSKVFTYLCWLVTLGCLQLSEHVLVFMYYSEVHAGVI